MPSVHRTCPECRTPLSLSRVPRGGNVRCPICDAVIGPADDEADESVQPRPGAVRPVARRVRPSDEEDDASRKAGAPIALGPILVGVSLGLLGLFVMGGALGTLWILSEREAESARPPVAAGEAPGVPIADDPDPAAAPLREPIRPARDNGGAPAAGALPLQELKAATVYIKNTTARVGHVTGSGFVVRSQGERVWVVTNHHVIAPLNPDDAPGRRGAVRPRAPVPPSAVRLEVVFRSGTPQEQPVPAVVTADDVRNDLALLRVDGVRDAPRPIDCRRTPEPVETMTVWAFGFPFGAALDPRKADPAITVTKGTVSSLRRVGNELAVVQIDGDLNPGNSGGPIVDERGGLIGVAVAKVEETRIGFAVPVRLLNQLLDGRLN